MREQSLCLNFAFVFFRDKNHDFYRFARKGAFLNAVIAVEAGIVSCF